nr:MAG TPA: hypothetical protein [Caudoviricetes sp.]
MFFVKIIYSHPNYLVKNIIFVQYIPLSIPIQVLIISYKYRLYLYLNK